QWRIGDMKDVKSAMVAFDAGQFEAHLASHQEFQLTIQRALQISGQTGFYIGYDDIPDVQILNGLVRFLGVEEQKKRTSGKTKKQNPQSLEEKVTNHAQMLSALASTDHFGLYRTPNFEPRRGPMVPGYVAAAKSPILFMPVMSCPYDGILQWLADLDGVSISDLTGEFNQKSLRQWKRQAKDHQSFCVLRHPVARLHRAFVERILMPGPMAYADIRDTLRRVFGLPLPKAEPDAAYDIGAHRKAFLAFAEFVKGNLAGQSSVRVDGAWASQSEWVRGMARFLLPMHIFREADLGDDLCHLAQRFG
ncbi:MAG: nodulation protein NodH, partial [Paracoccaceae bacterium]